jgi:rhamnosyltransferase
MKKPSVVCLIPAYQGRAQLNQLMLSLKVQKCDFTCYVMDSGSTDGTTEVAQSYGVPFDIIRKNSFDHGGTRKLMADKYREYDILVYMTQDITLRDPDALKRLIEPFTDPNVGAVGGRQIPYRNATVVAQHARLFNYPAVSRQVCSATAKSLGLKSVFLSNSFAAYRATALHEIGGFPSNSIMCEDSYVAARLLLLGWSVRYQADAVCYHSHNYTARQEAARYFDLGVFHARETWIREEFGAPTGEGLRYLKSELRFVWNSAWYLAPTALLRNAMKFISFKLGLWEAWLPKRLKMALSMHKQFWLK